MSVHNFTRALVDGEWNLTPASLRAELRILFGDQAANFHITAVGTTLTATSSEDLDGTDTASLTACVSSLKSAFSAAAPVGFTDITVVDVADIPVGGGGLQYEASWGQKIVFTGTTATDVFILLPSVTLSAQTEYVIKLQNHRFDGLVVTIQGEGTDTFYIYGASTAISGGASAEIVILDPKGGSDSLGTFGA